MRNVFYLAAILCVAISIGSSLPAEPAQSQTSRGDGIFTPVISPVAAIDKTGRPFTIEVTQPEPSFATSMIAGKPTGDSYVIHFPTGDAGGACMYSGTGRYLIESTRNLTFQILADCGKLRRGYSYMICMLDATLRCTEAPWWYFKDRTYAITNQGVVINGSTVRPWRDAAEAPQELQAMAAKIKSMRERFASLKDSHVVHTRFISCRAYHPATKSYEIHEFATTCLVRSLCNGIPNVDTLRDGERIDWNSPVGSYVKQQGKTSDVSNWVCWMRTQ